MTSEIIIPDLGGSDTVTLDEWLVEPGTFIKAGTPLALVTTAKATVEIECFRDGYIRELIATVGQTLELGATIAYIADSLEEVTSKAPSDENHTLSQIGDTVINRDTSPALDTLVRHTNGFIARVQASPLARRLARENSLKLTEIIGSGPQGQCLKRDVLRTLGELQQKAVRSKNVATSQFHLSTTIDMTEALAVLKRLHKHGLPAAPKPALHDLCIYIAARSLTKKQVLSEPIDRITLVIESQEGTAKGVVEQPALLGLDALAGRTQQLSSDGQKQDVEKPESPFMITCVNIPGIADFFQNVEPPFKMNLSLGSPDKSCALMKVWLSVESGAVTAGVAAGFLQDLRELLENPFDVLLMF